MSNRKETSSDASRREFLQTGSKIAVAGAVGGSILKPSTTLAQPHVAGSDSVRLGLIGCGGRGTGASVQAMNTKSGNVELVAMADAFQDRLQGALKSCQGAHNDKVRVPESKQYVGYDAYKHVIGSDDVDMVILATPPGFRPLHFEAAIEANKHVFMEKPVAVDAPGIRRVLKAGELAKQKGLAVAVGLQRRHERAYRETISALQDGIIGDLISSRVIGTAAASGRARENRSRRN